MIRHHFTFTFIALCKNNQIERFTIERSLEICSNKPLSATTKSRESFQAVKNYYFDTLNLISSGLRRKIDIFWVRSLDMRENEMNNYCNLRRMNLLIFLRDSWPKRNWVDEFLEWDHVVNQVVESSKKVKGAWRIWDEFSLMTFGNELMRRSWKGEFGEYKLELL